VAETIGVPGEMTGGTVHRVSVDIGGTFTDFVLQDAFTGDTTTGKVLSTPGDLALAVIDGLRRFLPEASKVDFLVHGTTAGLNALIERRGARVLLVTTEGFRDVYTIAGNDRREIFNIRYRKPQPLVPPERIVEVRERLGADGSVVVPIELASLDKAIETARSEAVDAVAICLLFSYLNPSHELEVERYLAERLPGIPLTCSHRVSREWREYARTSTAVMNAYVAPIVTRYLTTLMESLEGGLTRDLLVMQSNGGIMTARAARELPVQTLLSGPVGGAIGAQELARSLGRDDLICIDMGGTSFDVSLVTGSSASVSNEADVEGLPLQMSIVDIYGVGAGGGSVGWTEAGAMRVGPQSAGADPGPACYGRGGAEPTVTDANLLLGRVDERKFAGGGMSLDAEAARKAMARLAEQLDMGVLETAQGMVDVVNAKMADAISTVTVRRGIDPRTFSLVAFGGAGPMHAVDLANQLDISEVIVPVLPGTFSAWGMLHTDFRRDVRRTLYRDLSQVDAGDLDAEYRRLEQEGADFLSAEGLPAEAVSFERTADLRYAGQEYSLTVPVGLAPEGSAGPIDVPGVRQLFDRLYMERYGHSNPAAPAELVKIGVVATGQVPRPAVAAPVTEARTGWDHRKVLFAGESHDCPIVPREQLAPGDQVEGGAIIEEATSTTVVPPGWALSVLEGGHLVIRRPRVIGQER
jgi:N-methylhydantoinase A